MTELSGNLTNNVGAAVACASVAAFPTSVCATETTSACCATATTTTSAAGLWAFSCLAANTYDVRITEGTSVRWRRYSDEVQHTRWATGDGGTVAWGAADDVQMRWSTADASNHAFVVGLGATNAAIHLANLGDIASDWALCADADPQIFIHSNTCPITQYLRIGAHDGCNADIDLVGGATLRLRIAGTTEVSLTGSALSLENNTLCNVGAAGNDWSANSITLAGARAVSLLI